MGILYTQMFSHLVRAHRYLVHLKTSLQSIYVIIYNNDRLIIIQLMLNF